MTVHRYPTRFQERRNAPPLLDQEGRYSHSHPANTYLLNALENVHRCHTINERIVASSRFVDVLLRWPDLIHVQSPFHTNLLKKVQELHTYLQEWYEEHAITPAVTFSQITPEGNEQERQHAYTHVTNCVQNEYISLAVRLTLSMKLNELSAI